MDQQTLLFYCLLWLVIGGILANLLADQTKLEGKNGKVPKPMRALLSFVLIVAMPVMVPGIMLAGLIISLRR